MDMLKASAPVQENKLYPEPPPPYFSDSTPGAGGAPVPPASAPGFVYPPISGMQQQQQQPQEMQMQATPPQHQQPQVVVTAMSLGPNPATLSCPHCKNVVTTRLDKKAGVLAWVAGFVLCLVGCSCGCCLIPCCVCQDVEHFCSNCGAYVGKYTH